MLRLGLIEAKKLGIERILISAHADNPASWKTIKRCGGIFLKSIDDEGKKLKVYWIHLDDTTSTTHVFPSPEIITKKKPSRNEIKAKIQYEKAQIRIAKKASIRKKSEKKLVEKSKRKEAHKKANSQKKFKAKIQKNTASQF